MRRPLFVFAGSSFGYTFMTMTILHGKSEFVTVGGVKTHYVVSGNGRPVALIHGLGESVITWRDNIEPLSRRHKVFALDLPGHGDSEKPDLSYDADSMVYFLRGFFESLGIERPALIGHSMVGGLSLMTALAHPNIVSRLMLVGSACLGREVNGGLRIASLKVLGELMTSRFVGSTGVMLKTAFGDQSFVTPELLDELKRANRSPGARRAALKVIRNTVSILGVKSEYILHRRLKELEMPVLIAWGTEDKILPVKHAHRAELSDPRTDIHVFGSCGHWPHMKRSDEFNSLTLEFLSR